MSERILVCPGCNYNKDFHVLSTDNKDTDNIMYKINTKCPNCGLEFSYNSVTKNRGSKFI